MNNEFSTLYYSAESALRHPVTLFRSMISQLFHSWQLAWRITIRDINALYRQSLLGVFWAFVPPVLSTLVFVMLNRYQVLNVGEIEVPYPVYAFVGLTLWQLFTESMLMPMKIMGESRSVIAKINFPHEALIVSSVLQTLFNFGIRILLLIALLLLYKVNISWTFLLFPLGVIGLILLGISLGVFLVPLGMLYSDVTQSLTLIVGLWMFITPVVYMPSTQGFLGKIVMLNPVTPILQFTRDLLLTGSFAYFGRFLLVSAICLIILVFGWIVFRVSLPFIVERISA